MVLESKSQSPPVMILRPTTLHLGSTHQEANNNNGVKTLVADDDVDLTRNKRRKKRRSADVSLKRFSGKIFLTELSYLFYTFLSNGKHLLKV